MKKFLEKLGAFVAAVLATGVLASIFSTQFVIAALAEVGIEIPFGTRLNMTVTDLPVIQLFGILAIIAFLVAFLVAALCTRFLPGSRQFWFTFGGAVSIVAGLVLLQNLAGNMPMGGARSTLGLLFQGLAGAAGGWLFQRLTQPQEAAA